MTAERETAAATPALDPLRCSSCPHGELGHSAVERRYCAATKDHVPGRNCICRSA
ncbi:MAG: RGCVC family protein [Jatrophihabitans sp.]|uniref:RGCVC family protein n=1 Tax=Jatrophihabitans sp. TaxID=1932789 RepID=UPI003F7DF599